MEIWRLGPDRADEWREIRLAALRDAPEAFGATLEDWQDRPPEDFGEWLRNVPTFASGDRVGEPLAVAAWRTGMDADDTGRAWLIAVFARPAARGCGYAEAVIRAVLADAARGGATSVGLNVVTTNLPALALYRRLGFRHSGREVDFSTRGDTELEMILSQLPTE